MVILSLDPSSTICGYAALRTDGSLVEAAAILPAARADPSFERVVSMGEELARVLKRLKPDVVLIEWTKGKVNVGRHTGLGAGLAVYGCGVGWLGAVVWHWAVGRTQCHVEAVLENDWTRGIPKEQRQLAVTAAYPEYAVHLADDPGGDIADAIGLGGWWIRERQLLLKL